VQAGYAQGGEGTYAHACAQIVAASCVKKFSLPGEKDIDAKLVQNLGQLQPFIGVFPQECMGQLGYFGSTWIFWANLTPFSLMQPA
jgi:hypothetical protein